MSVSVSKVDVTKLNPMKCIPYKATKVIMVVLSCLMYAVAYYHRICPSILSNEIAKAVGKNETDLGTFGSMYFWTYALIQPVIGIIADFVEPAFLLAGSSFLEAVGSLGTALSHSYALTCLCRALIGLGSGPMTVCIFKIFASWFTPRGFYLGSGAILMCGATGGILAQGPLASLIKHVDWRITFIGAGVLGVLFGILTLIFIRASPARLGYTELETDSVPAEEEKEEPLHGCALFKQTLRKLLSNFKTVLSNWNFWKLILWVCCIPATFYNFSSLWGKMYLTDGFGIELEKAGYILVLLNLAYIVGTPVISFFSEFFHTRKWILVTTSVIAFGISFGFIFLTPSGPIWVLYILIFVYGFVACAPTSTAVTMFKEFNVPELSGTTLGCSNFFQFISTSLLQILVTVLLNHLDPGKKSGKTTWTGFQRSLWIPFAITSFIGLIGILFVHDTYPKARACTSDDYESINS